MSGAAAGSLEYVSTTATSWAGGFSGCGVRTGETLVALKPKSEWRMRSTWYSSWAPHFLLPVLRHFTPDHISEQELIAEMNAALKVPGFSNAWTMPIRGRVEMLTTGIQTPIRLEDSRDRPDADSGNRHADRACTSRCAGHAKRVCRTRRRWLLPRCGLESRSPGPIRHLHGRGAECAFHGCGRRKRQHDD